MFKKDSDLNMQEKTMYRKSDLLYHINLEKTFSFLTCLSVSVMNPPLHSMEGERKSASFSFVIFTCSVKQKLQLTGDTICQLKGFDMSARFLDNSIAFCNKCDVSADRSECAMK